MKKLSIKKIKHKHKKTSGFLTEFRTFAMRGNVMDLAVGVIIGGAFQKIVNSLVNDILMPLIGYATGGIDFSDKHLILSVSTFDSIEEAKAAGAVVLNYGSFVSAILDFLIMAFVIFCIIKGLNSIGGVGTKIRKNDKTAEEPPPPPTTKSCPYCLSEIKIEATKCPFCTSDLE